MGRTLFPYQAEGLSRLRQACATARRVLAVAPTGSGKTTVGSAIAAGVVARGKRVLWLAHRKELVEQSYQRLVEELGKEAVGVVSASASGEVNEHRPVQVASIQTLLARGQRPPADFVIADEAHHFGTGAETWSGLYQAYRDAWCIGFTATPERSDGSGLGEAFEKLVVLVQAEELVSSGFLVHAEVVAPTKQLGALEVAQRPVDAYLQHARGRRAFLFCRRVAEAEKYANQFADAGVESWVVSAESSLEERTEVLEHFRAGRCLVLANCGVYTEGTDVPEAEVAILARGCGTAGIYLQMVGRVLRPAPGKMSALILDLVGSSHTWGHPEDERSYSLDGTGISSGEGDGNGAAAAEGEGLDESEQRVVRAKLERLEVYERMRKQDSPEAKVARLARWLIQAREKKFKDGWAGHKYHAVYGSWPDGVTKARAKAQSLNGSAA